MKTLEQLKAELEMLTEQVNNALVSNNDTIQLTREQLKSIISKAIDQTKSKIKAEILDVGMNGEDYISLELCDREICVDFDSDLFLSDVTDNIDEFRNDEEIEDDELDKLLNDIKEA